MKKFVSVIKDGAIGMAMGTAVIVPGISAGTIALVFGAFKKIVGAVSGLFKKFWKSLLILLPFGIGAVIAVAGLYIPFKLALEHCLFAIVCLFAGFILGGIPGITDGVKGEKPDKVNIAVMIVGFLVAAGIGISSVAFNFSGSINSMFDDPHWYLYLIVFAVGFIGSTGLIVPGLSGSLILLVIGFYGPIFKLPGNIVDGTNRWHSLGLLSTFAVGVIVGFIVFSKLMDHLLSKHKKSTYYTIIGFVCGSLIAIFVNSNMFDYLKNSAWLLDWILGPILFVVALVLSYLLVLYVRKHPQEKEESVDKEKENA